MQKFQCLLFVLAALACNFTESNTPSWVFFMFLDCTNGTKSRIASHMFIIMILWKADQNSLLKVSGK